MAGSTLFRGLTKSQYDEFLKTGMVVPDGRTIGERDILAGNSRYAQGPAVYTGHDQAVLHAGRDGHVLQFDPSKVKYLEGAASGESGLTTMRSQSHLSISPISKDAVLTSTPTADIYDDLIDRHARAGTVPVAKGKSIGDSLVHGDTIQLRNLTGKKSSLILGPGTGDQRHAGELFTRENGNGGMRWIEPSNVLNEGELTAARERIAQRSANAPVEKPLFPEPEKPVERPKLTPEKRVEIAQEKKQYQEMREKHERKPEAQHPSPAPTKSAALNSPEAAKAANTSDNVSKGNAASPKPTPAKSNDPVKQATRNPTDPKSAPQQASNAATNASQGKPATTEHPSSPHAQQHQKQKETQRAEQKNTGQETARATTEGKPTNAAPIKPPTKHETVPDNPALPDTPHAGSKTSTVGTELKDSYKSFAAKPFKHRAAVTGIVGGALGILTSDQKSESVIGTIMDGGMGAGLAIGSESAVNYIMKNHSNQISEFLDKGKQVSTGDLTKITNEIDVEKMAGKMKAGAGKMGWVAAGVAAFIGTTALMGVSSKLERNSEVARMEGDAERALKRKDQKERKAMSEMFGYNKHQPMGQLVMDMWEDRTGHHKMGNSKFQ